MMIRNDRDSLTDLLHQINDRFQALSHKIHWTTEDSECLDNLVGSQEHIKGITARITISVRKKYPSGARQKKLIADQEKKPLPNPFKSFILNSDQTTQ